MSYFNDPIRLEAPCEDRDYQLVIEPVQNMCSEIREKNRLPHSHDFYSVYWITRGEAIHATRYVEYSVEAGSLLFVPKGVVHRMIVDENCKGVSIFFNDSLFSLSEEDKAELSVSALFNNPDFRSVIRLEDKESGFFSDVIGMMQSESDKKDEYHLEMNRHLIKLFLLQANRLHQLQYTGSIEKNPGSENILIVRFKNLIEENYQKEKSVSAYAEMLNIRPVQLNEICKTITGITAGEHIRNRTLREAKKMLYASGKNAKEIAYSLGFDDPAYFSRFFKKYTGLTINGFRTLSRKKSN